MRRAVSDVRVAFPSPESRLSLFSCLSCWSRAPRTSARVQHRSFAFRFSSCAFFCTLGLEKCAPPPARAVPPPPGQCPAMRERVSVRRGPLRPRSLLLRVFSVVSKKPSLKPVARRFPCFLPRVLAVVCRLCGICLFTRTPFFVSGSVTRRSCHLRRKVALLRIILADLVTMLHLTVVVSFASLSGTPRDGYVTIC